MPHHRTVMGRLLAGTVLAGTLAACSPVSSPASDPGLYAPKLRVHMISRELSLAIGERDYAQSVSDLEAEGKLEKNARVNQRVQAIAMRLVQQAVLAYPVSKDWAWELHVVQDDAHNASCGAGGKMFLNTGLLALTRFDEHKVATVLGHEIAHALLEHVRGRIGRSVITWSTLEVMSQSFKMGRLRLGTLAQGMETVTLPLEREQEREADLLGLQLMARAGFNPVRGAGIWADMQGDEPAPRLQQRLETYLSSHPTDGERLATLADVARQLAASGATKR